MWEIDEGWKPMVTALVSLCVNYCKERNLPFTIEQVKEKFGELRFYYSGGDDYVRELVDSCERQSSIVCEVCGELGKRRGGGWLKTLCDDHHLEREERRRGT
jgi:tRNA(Ile)-lysidine synthase TilS/MesJ